MEQLVARKAHNLEVVRSSRAPATKSTSQAIGIHRGVEQLVARKAHNLEVIRSSRVSATLEDIKLKFNLMSFLFYNKSPILRFETEDLLVSESDVYRLAGSQQSEMQSANTTPYYKCKVNEVTYSIAHP